MTRKGSSAASTDTTLQAALLAVALPHLVDAAMIERVMVEVAKHFGACANSTAEAIIRAALGVSDGES